MLYEIKVFKFFGNKRKVISTIEVWGPTLSLAIRKACPKLGPERMAEIREIPDPIQRPTISKIQRDGVI